MHPVAPLQNHVQPTRVEPSAQLAAVVPKAPTATVVQPPTPDPFLRTLSQATTQAVVSTLPSPVSIPPKRRNVSVSRPDTTEIVPISYPPLQLPTHGVRLSTLQDINSSPRRETDELEHLQDTLYGDEREERVIGYPHSHPPTQVPRNPNAFQQQPFPPKTPGAFKGKAKDNHVGHAGRIPHVSPYDLSGLRPPANQAAEPSRPRDMLPPTTERALEASEGGPVFFHRNGTRTHISPRSMQIRQPPNPAVGTSHAAMAAQYSTHAATEKRRATIKVAFQELLSFKQHCITCTVLLPAATGICKHGLRCKTNIYSREDNAFTINGTKGGDCWSQFKTSLRFAEGVVCYICLLPRSIEAHAVHDTTCHTYDDLIKPIAFGIFVLHYYHPHGLGDALQAKIMAQLGDSRHSIFSSLPAFAAWCAENGTDGFPNIVNVALAYGRLRHANEWSL